MSPYVMMDPDEYYWYMEAVNEEVEETKSYAQRVVRMEYDGEGESHCLNALVHSN